ncbi:hypothetical protein [Actinopolymorpha pittospori]
MTLIVETGERHAPWWRTTTCSSTSLRLLGAASWRQAVLHILDSLLANTRIRAALNTAAS